MAGDPNEACIKDFLPMLPSLCDQFVSDEGTVSAKAEIACT